MSSDEARLREALTGRYDIERELGHGGMATVYLARDLKHERQVAVKVLRPDLSAALGGERFLREVAITAKLQHPHILTLIDSGEAAGFLYYVMPYVEGESLRARLAREGAMPVSEAARLLRDVVEALAYAHRHGVVHRDIKPDNVMLSGRHALMVDFGVAKAVGAAAASGEHGLTTIGVSLGTPAYMAPEQAAGDPTVDARADIYSIGILAYEMLTGRTPFHGPAQQVLMQQLTAAPEPLQAARPEVPLPLAEAVMRCLEKTPDRRYQAADQLLEELEAYATPGAGIRGVATPRSRRVPVLAAAAAVLVLGAAATYFVQRGRDVRWVRTTAIPAIEQLASLLEHDSAFVLANRARAILPDDPTLDALWQRITAAQPINTQPPGATVHWAPFSDTTRWTLVGTSPIDSVRFPAISYVRLRLELPGYHSREVLYSGQAAPFVLMPMDAGDTGMVYVSRGNYTARLPGLDQLPPMDLGDFLMDRHEVTNRQYRDFVLAGGYEKPEFWPPIVDERGGPLRLEEARLRFIDRTGRVGPATWEAGDIPRGEEDLPVGGVSWYEAAAYAKFAGKALPTVYHWSRAAEPEASAWVVPGSTLEAARPARGSTYRGMSPFGVFDMAGNVREWTANSDGAGKYFILGGGWSDFPYAFNDAYAQGPFDRSLINGIRLVQYPDGQNLALAQAPVHREVRDYYKEKPVGDAIFETYRQIYDYDRTPLKATVESRDTTPADWITEKVTFDAAYANDRVVTHLFLPKRGAPPYQTVVYFPGDGGVGARARVARAPVGAVDFYLKSGRAVIAIVLKSTYERSDSLRSTIPNESIAYRDHVLMWAKDVRRAIDYVATRPELDSTRIAYFGVSFGGRLGGLIPAVEPRIKTAVLFVAGFRMQRPRPEADPFHFVSRVTVPVLMLNAKYDDYFPTESSQKPFFQLLGSAPDAKRYVVYEGGHILPRTQLISEALAWLDKYLGPVR